MRSERPVPSNLPNLLTSFVGRERDLVELRRLLATNRLLTLTGPGGCGKTRLAIELAHKVTADPSCALPLREPEDVPRPEGSGRGDGSSLAHGSPFPDGVRLVKLAALAEPSLLPQSVAAALGLPEEPGRPLLQTLQTWAGSRQFLLVLDNCEHLISACAALVEALLVACPALTVLATSREVLRIDGEQVYLVPPLSLPPFQDRARRNSAGVSASQRDGDLSHAPRMQSLIRSSDAVQLFCERAKHVRPRFVLDERNAYAVAEVCWRLDGIPLALELAAAHLRALDVEQLAARLAGHSAFRSTGARTASPRQQTLQASLDWSYDLLTPNERALFNRLAVFAGGFSLRAVETLGAGALETLERLIEKSMVLVDEQSSEPRYRLLEIVRAYGLERLAESGERERVQIWHAGYYVALAEEAQLALMGPEQTIWLERMEQEHDNLRAAIAWLHEHGEIGHEGASNEEVNNEGACRELTLVAALWRFWEVRGHLQEGHERIEAALTRHDAVHGFRHLPVLPERQHASASPCASARAQAIDGAGVLAWRQGDYATASARFEASLEAWRALGETRKAARVLNNLGLVLLHRGEPARAVALFEECLAIVEALAEPWEIAVTRLNLGAVACERGDADQAQRFLEESLAAFRELGDERGVAFSLHHLGLVHLRLLRQHGGNAAGATVDEERSRALSYQRESLTIRLRIGDRPGVAECLIAVAELACEGGAAHRAARLLAAAEGLRAELAVLLSPSHQATSERTLVAARAALTEAGFAGAWAGGQALLVTEAAAEALQLTYTLDPRAEPASDGSWLSAEPMVVPPIGLTDAGLTAREVEVLGLLGAGRSNKQIASEFVISIRTVEQHVQNIYAKIGVHRRTEAVAFALRHGLIASH